MAHEKAMTSTFSFTHPEWLKPFDGIPRDPDAAASRETLEFTASRLQEQADHLHSLAKCGDLTDAMKCQLEFAQQSCSRAFGEASKVFERLRMASPTSS
jgi:phasin family protein